MSIFKDIVYPLIPAAFETLVRVAVLGPAQWTSWVNPGTIFLTFAIWGALTATRVPRVGRIPTDEDYKKTVERTKNYLSALAMVGILCFGGVIVLQTIDQAGWISDPGNSAALKFTFSASSLLYAVYCVSFIGINREMIRELYIG